jgi:hypothetical protein
VAQPLPDCHPPNEAVDRLRRGRATTLPHKRECRRRCRGWLRTTSGRRSCSWSRLSTDLDGVPNEAPTPVAPASSTPPVSAPSEAAAGGLAVALVFAIVAIQHANAAEWQVAAFVAAGSCGALAAVTNGGKGS